MYRSLAAIHGIIGCLERAVRRILRRLAQNRSFLQGSEHLYGGSIPPGSTYRDDHSNLGSTKNLCRGSTGRSNFQTIKIPLVAWIMLMVVSLERTL